MVFQMHIVTCRMSDVAHLNNNHHISYSIVNLSRSSHLMAERLSRNKGIFFGIYRGFCF